jgi:hypothetical protein
MLGDKPLSQDAWNSRQSRQNAWRGAHPRAAVEVGNMQRAERIPAGVGIRTNVSTIRKSNSAGITAAIGGMGGGGRQAVCFMCGFPERKGKVVREDWFGIRERICDI